MLVLKYNYVGGSFEEKLLQVYTAGSPFGLIFLLFPKKIAGGHAHSSWGKSPTPGS